MHIIRVFIRTNKCTTNIYICIIKCLRYVKYNIYCAEALVVATKEIGLEVNTDKTKYIILSRDQNAGRSHNMQIDSSSIVRVEEFKYLGTTLTNQNSLQGEIKSRLKLGNACYYSVQNLLSSSLLSKKERSRYIEL